MTRAHQWAAVITQKRLIKVPGKETTKIGIIGFIKLKIDTVLPVQLKKKQPQAAISLSDLGNQKI